MESTSIIGPLIRPSFPELTLQKKNFTGSPLHSPNLKDDVSDSNFGDILNSHYCSNKTSSKNIMSASQKKISNYNFQRFFDLFLTLISYFCAEKKWNVMLNANQIKEKMVSLLSSRKKKQLTDFHHKEDFHENPKIIEIKVLIF